MSHNQNRKLVCVGCFSPGCKRYVTTYTEQFVKQFIYSGYNKDSFNLPCGLCSICRITITSQNKTHGPKRTLPDKIDYDTLTRSIKRESNRELELCKCYICLAARKTWLKAHKNKPGPKAVYEHPTNETKCSFCFIKIGRGIPHQCSKAAAVSNLTKLANATKVAERVATNIFKNKQQSVTSIQSQPTPFKTGGPKLNISFTNSQIKKKKDPQISHEEINDISLKLGLSDKKTLLQAHAIRSTFGRSSIKPGLSKYLSDKSREMEDFLTVKTLGYISSKVSKKEDQKHTVCVKDLNKFIQYVEESRYGRYDNILSKIFIDSGKDHMKVCLSLIDLLNIDNNDNITKKRHSFFDTDSFKDSSVKKIFIIGIVPKVLENYSNIKKIWTEIFKYGDSQVYKISGDQKIINILCGIQSHSSSYPCPWCLDKTPWKGSSLRTLGSLRNHYKKWLEDGANPNYAKNYYNVVNECLIHGDDKDLVLKHIPPCGLHLLLRTFNHIWENLSKQWTLLSKSDKTVKKTGTICSADDFAKSINAVRSAYHGGAFNGNQCNQILKKSDKLYQYLPKTLHNYVHCLTSFQQVINGCFSYNLDRFYEDKISKFGKAYEKLGISETPSVHAIKTHVVQWIKLDGETRGIGLFSEQAGESVHYDWEDNTWVKGYKVPQSHPAYGQNLLKAVAKYNSRHI